MAKRPAAKKAARRPAARRTAPSRPATKRPATKRSVKKRPAAKTSAKKAVTPARTRPKSRPRPASAARTSPLFAPLKGAERRNIGHVQLEVGRAGKARVKRMIYPPGFHWAKDMKPVTGTDLCMHAHVGFLAHGEIHIEYADGCIVEFKAPQVVEIAPGHDGWVVGKEPVVLIEIDFERDTAGVLGLITHSHTK